MVLSKAYCNIVKVSKNEQQWSALEQLLQFSTPHVYYFIEYSYELAQKPFNFINVCIIHFYGINQ